MARTAPAFEQALGTHILKIDQTAVGEAMDLALELTPADENASLRRALAVNYLGVGLILHGLAIIPDRAVAQFTFRDDAGNIFTMDLPSSPTRNKDTWVRPHAYVFLTDQHHHEPFWCVNILSARTVYCDFRSYDGLRGRSTAMVDLISQAAPEKLVIDMRDNGGGDSLARLAAASKPTIVKAPSRNASIKGPEEVQVPSVNHGEEALPVVKT